MNPSILKVNDTSIVSRLLKPEREDFSPDLAREILSLQFDPVDRERMNQLSLKVQSGDLLEDEQAELESYRRVGCMLGVLWSKARLSLKRAGLEVPDGHRV